VRLLPRHLRNRYLLIADTLLLAVGLALAYTARFEGTSWVATEWTTAWRFFVVATPIRLGIYISSALYNRLWEHASVADVQRIVLGAGGGSLLAAVAGIWGLPAIGVVPLRVPVSVAILDAILGIVFAGALRLALRIVAHSRTRLATQRQSAAVLVAGAGASGRMVARELWANAALGMEPVGFVDDDPVKRGRYIGDLRVIGSLSDIPEVIRGYGVDRVVIAMPSAPGEVVRRVVDLARSSGVPTLTVPSLGELLSGRMALTAVREVRIDDLLRRAPVQLDLAAVASLVGDRSVLVTGAGGSIGSELCRQIAAIDPSRLILVGHGENSIFDIQQELRRTFPGLAITAVIADIRDRARMFELIEDHRPSVVFHAAAHKHVPLMEDNPREAILNNVSGTRNVVDACERGGVPQLVLISTDKAVRPTSVMGATKRIAEQVLQLSAVRSGRRYVAVRFGNVLGSRGSVVPTFLRQIRDGGPVTVTDPRMRRYFMTIPEAVQLVLQAGAQGVGAEVFVLDMGEPVLVVDLARDLIRLSGYEPDRDIGIAFTGMRPGEKLYEEMFFSNEEASPTEHPKILRARKAGLPDDASRRIDALIDAAQEGRPDDALRRMIKALVPDYTGYDALPAGADAAGVPAAPGAAGMPRGR
jgi:FlaA1/EpsC-like NDP-sugar epimerase